MRTRSRARALLGAVLTSAALFAVACGDDDSGATKAAAGGKPDKITIAYQAIPNGDLVVKHEKWLEQAFPGTKIEWKQFDSGGSVNEAVAAGAIDIGLAGSSPVARGLSQPLPYQVPWIHDVIGKAESLVARGDVSSVADLKGKTVATPLASTSHYSLLAALKDAGLSAKDVKIIDAEPPDIAAAWQRGDIDAAYVWNPVLAQLRKDGGKVITDSAQLAKEGKTTYDLAVVSNDFASKYPAAVKTWLEQENRAVELYRSDPQAAATAVGAELNIPPAEALAQMKDLIFLTADEQAAPDRLGGALGKDLYATAEFNKSLGQIPEIQDESAYEQAVKPAFAKGLTG